MLALFRLFFDIALLKKGPQDVPYSLFLLILLFMVLFFIDLSPSFIPDSKGKLVDFVIQLRYLIVANLVSMLVIFLVFKFYNKTNRFLQSFTAITGVELILKLVQLPVYILSSGSANSEPSMLLALMGLLLLIMIGWYLVVYTHIFHNGLSISRINAAMLAFTIVALSFFMSVLLIPAEV